MVMLPKPAATMKHFAEIMSDDESFDPEANTMPSMQYTMQVSNPSIMTFSSIQLTLDGKTCYWITRGESCMKFSSQ